MGNNPTFLRLSLVCRQQAVRLKHFEPRPTPTLRHQWGESSLYLLWPGAKKTWPWLRGRSFPRPSTSPSSEPPETRRALCLLSPVQGHPPYLDRRPFRSASTWLWVMVLFSVKDIKTGILKQWITSSLTKCCVCIFVSQRNSLCFVFLFGWSQSVYSYPVSLSPQVRVPYRVVGLVVGPKGGSLIHPVSHNIML